METQDDNKYPVQRVEQGNNKKQKDLKRSFLFGDNGAKSANTAGMEGQGVGGHKFGQENHPPTGNDPNNPSQNAGTTNAFLAQTDPLEEYTDNNNFKVQNQQGEPDYDGAQPYAKGPKGITDMEQSEDGPSEYME